MLFSTEAICTTAAQNIWQCILCSDRTGSKNASIILGKKQVCICTYYTRGHIVTHTSYSLLHST